VLDGIHIGATWPIRLNRPCSAAMSYITTDHRRKLGFKKWRGPDNGERRARAYNRVWGEDPADPGAEPLVRDQGAGFERNWWSDCQECHLESFLVRYTTEDSFIIGVACGKKW